MYNGWVKLHRRITDWEWYQDANTFRVFMHLMATANHETNKWQGVTIDKGQLITSPDKIATALKLSRQQVRTSLTKLKSTSEITIKTTNKYTVVTLCQWESYQGKDDLSPTEQPATQQTNNQQITSKQPTDNQQVTTNKKLKELKELKEVKEVKNILARKRASVLDFSSWPSVPDPTILADWKAVRKAKLTQTAVNQLAAQLHLANNNGITVNDCLAECATRGWRGFKYEWIAKDNISSSSPHDVVDQAFAEMEANGVTFGRTIDV